jgi:hypothetical protein
LGLADAVHFQEGKAWKPLDSIQYRWFKEIKLVPAPITLQLPERLYQRLVNTAQATQRPLEEVIIHALKVGSPPDWDDVPEEFQANLAALDRLDDAALWAIARSHRSSAEMTRYDELLDRNQEGALSDSEKLELTELRQAADAFMLRKAHTVVLLRWRGHLVPHP